MSYTEDFAQKFLEELNCETVFTIPIFGGSSISESVVVTWIIMALMTGASICFVRNLKLEHPDRKQLVLETAIGGIYHFFEDILGEHGRGNCNLWFRYSSYDYLILKIMKGRRCRCCD